MFKRFSTNYMAALFLLDGLLIQCSLWLSIQARFALPIGQDLKPEWSNTLVYIPSWRMYLAIGALWLISFLLLSVYSPRMIIRWSDEFQRIIVAHTLAALSLAGLLYMAKLELARLTYLYLFVIALSLLLGYRTLLRFWHRLHRADASNIARILVVGAGRSGQELVAELQRLAWPGIELVGYLDDDPEKQGKHFLNTLVLGPLDRAAQVVRDEQIDEVLVALPAHAHTRLANLVTMLHTLPVRVRVVPDYFGLAYFGATVESLGGIPLIGLRDPAIDEVQRLAKRLLDIFISAGVLLLASPVMALVALAIKLEDGGPILYGAQRVGENGKLFRMWKFRSMIMGADRIFPNIGQSDASGRVLYKVAEDPRITRVGRWLRRTSIDELPQLFNVLKGEMSIVGPRPELPWLVENYEPWQRKRFAVPQGMTGWWQVNGRSDNPMHLHTEQDLYYIQNYSLWLDLQILWRTIGVVLRGRGAY
jgi:exopolysaccharide biosynthesis polyprenyl glycosylphosphotransferase